jgi:hypothetical protein
MPVSPMSALVVALVGVAAFAGPVLLCVRASARPQQIRRVA